jgi:hypothetical protein
VQLRNHTATHRVESIDALWQGGVNGMVLTGSAIRIQDAETQERIRAALVRRVAAYEGADGLRLPVAFNIGTGRKPQ